MALHHYQVAEAPDLTLQDQTDPQFFVGQASLELNHMCGLEAIAISDDSTA
jgi:hypothetical protein